MEHTMTVQLVKGDTYRKRAIVAQGFACHSRLGR
jgi:hypothetical protein